MKLAATDDVRVKAYDVDGEFVVGFYKSNFSNINQVFAEVRRKVPMHYSKRMIVVHITNERNDSTNEYRIPINKF